MCANVFKLDSRIQDPTFAPKTKNIAYINKILRFSRKTGKIQNIHKGQYNSKYVRKLKPINNNNSNIMPCYASAQDIPMVHFIRVKVLLSFYTGLCGPI